MFSWQEGEGPVQRGYARYIKKKKLDPLETYVPSVLQARLQLETAGRVMSKPTQLLLHDSFADIVPCC